MVFRIAIIRAGETTPPPVAPQPRDRTPPRESMPWVIWTGRPLRPCRGRQVKIVRVVAAGSNCHLQSALVVVVTGDALDPFLDDRPGRGSAGGRDFPASFARAHNTHDLLARGGAGVAGQVVSAVGNRPAG